jgi:hypothetical protein
MKHSKVDPNDATFKVTEPKDKPESASRLRVAPYITTKSKYKPGKPPRDKV